MIMQGCVILCGKVVFFQKPCNLSRSLLTNNNFYCAKPSQDCKYVSTEDRYSLLLSTSLLHDLSEINLFCIFISGYDLELLWPNLYFLVSNFMPRMERFYTRSFRKLGQYYVHHTSCSSFVVFRS